MVDNVDRRRRSEIMAGIKGRDTAPERVVRRIAHAMGLRFRLHRKDLPGRPDLVFPKHRFALFVHGCFWHRHDSCQFSHIPKTRVAYWREKFARTVARDKRNENSLRRLGWRVLVVWECEVGDEAGIERKLSHMVHRDDTHGDTSRPARTSSASPPRMPLVFVDAFAGCGGLSLGLKKAGWKGLFAIERDACAFETLSANFPPGDTRLGYRWPCKIEKKAWDIHVLLSQRRAELAQLAGKVDLLAGGPPCQGFSCAGRRRVDDPRNKLFEAYLDLVKILRPRLVLVENVRGFASDFRTSEGSGIKNYASALRWGLGAHYDLASAIIQARDFGLPQARPRFFLVGVAKDLGSQRNVDAFFDDMKLHARNFLVERGLPRHPTARDAISDLEIRRNGTVPCPDSKGFEAVGYVGPITPYQEAMRQGCDSPPPDTRLARHRADIRARFAAIIAACREEGRLGVTISTETRRAYGLKKMAIRVLDPLDAAPTITSLPDDLLHYSEPRTLTVRENARLQSFPDWFAFKGKYTTGGHRRRIEVPRFTQVANAVPPLLAEQLGLALLRVVRRLPPAEPLADRAAQ